MPGRPKRWRYVPRLWTLVLVAVMLGLSAVYLTIWRPYAERVAILTGIDGPRGWPIVVDARGPEWLRTCSAKSWLHGTGEDAPIGVLDDVPGLSFAQTEVNDQYLPRLRVFSQLKELRLDHSHVTDDGLKFLACHHSLEFLELSHNRIDGTGFPALRALPHLRTLCLAYTPIHDAQLATLTTLPELNCVGVHCCRHLTPEYVGRIVAKRPGWLDGLESLQWSWGDEERKRASGAPGVSSSNGITPAPVVELAH